MATLAPLTSPMRQPFGTIDGTRLRNLGNVKNRQNALPVTLSSPVKRRYSPASFDDADSENIDPSLFASPTKKAKGFDERPIKPTKTSRFTLTDASPTFSALTKSVPSPLRLETPRASISLKRKVSQTSSAPAAAGRSPKSKRVGILSRRRTSSSPFTRVNPPAFAAGGLPFSIDAALAGTVPSYKPRQLEHVSVPTLEESIPKGWMFDIHEDTTQEILDNLMEHSTSTLDISDNESCRAAKDDRGKENVPPGLEYTASVAAPTVRVAPISRKDAMTEEVRNPLGDLDAKEFYAEGCDALSCFIVPAEKHERSNEPVVEDNHGPELRSPIHPNLDAPAATQQQWNDILPKTDEFKEFLAGTGHSTSDLERHIEEAPEIEIWESESAKGDDEGTQESCVDAIEPISSTTSTLLSSLDAVAETLLR